MSRREVYDIFRTGDEPAGEPRDTQRGAAGRTLAADGRPRAAVPQPDAGDDDPLRAEDSKPIEWSRFRLRRADRGAKTCALCSGDIIAGEVYRDGGLERRAHETCVARAIA